MRRFLQEYVVDLNIRRAAIRAGYSERSAHVQGCQLLQHPLVQDELVRYFRATQGERQVAILRLIQEVENRVFLDPGDIFDQDGRMLPLGEMPAHARRCIDSIEVKRIPGRRGREPQEVVKVKLQPKGDAEEKHAKLLGLYRETIQQTNNVAQVHIYLPEKGSIPEGKVVEGEVAPAQPILGLSLPPKQE